MKKSRETKSLHLSKLIGASAKFSVVVIFSFTLVGCGDDKAPTVSWFMDNPTEIYRTLGECSYLTKYSPVPNYTWCENARTASITLSRRRSDLEKEKHLAAARGTPENLKTIHWYEGNRTARQAKLRECKVSAGKGDIEFDHGCFNATRAGMNQYIRGGSGAFYGETMGELTQILRAVSPLPDAVPPNARQSRASRNTLESEAPAGKPLPGQEPVELLDRVTKKVVAP